MADEDDRDAFKFDCLRNIFYHEDRERFFALADKFGSILVIILAMLVMIWRPTTVYAGLLAVLVASIQLVFDFGGKARLHAFLRARANELLIRSRDEIHSVPLLQAKLDRLYADEPPSMHAVNAVASNLALAALGMSDQDYFRIGKFHRFFRNAFAFNSVQFETFKEINESKG